jgi:hypothetical protein
MNRVIITEPVETLAVFGSGALVKTPSGRYEFHGGTPYDRADAMEWVSMFAPEIVVSVN